ncbi:MAG: arabinogalactan endo-1,4-beta-galactosidase [Proteobacteria bacterium]|nr:arabinogalactan endo-1,4-beta-galactosidase [Pseudomonadota bacterium]
MNLSVIRSDVPFESFFMGGFECATHRRRDGARVDAVVGQDHDRFVASDYAAMAAHGLQTVRDGLRWHLIEPAPGRYEWDGWRAMLRAAREAGVQVVWDLWHYGWPDWLDIWSPDFVSRMAAFAEAAARVRAEETDEVPLWCPVNEISYFAYMAGDQAEWRPYATGRGLELKRQLIRAAVAATDAVRRVDSRARILWCEPLVSIASGSREPAEITRAREESESQFQAFDMLSGRVEPELGGRPDVLDVVGVNIYSHNQWSPGGEFIPFGHYTWRPFSQLLGDVASRYGRPVIVAETGAEGSARSAWLHYITGEVEEARASGASIEGICLYPVCDYRGWDDDRLCPTGLLGAADETGRRPVFGPLARELRRLQTEMEAVRELRQLEAEMDPVRELRRLHAEMATAPELRAVAA